MRSVSCIRMRFRFIIHFCLAPSQTLLTTLKIDFVMMRSVITENRSCITAKRIFRAEKWLCNGAKLLFSTVSYFCTMRHPFSESIGLYRFNIEEFSGMVRLYSSFEKAFGIRALISFSDLRCSNRHSTSFTEHLISLDISPRLTSNDLGSAFWSIILIFTFL